MWGGGGLATLSMRRDTRVRLIASAVVLVAAVLFTRDPIPQDPAYHRFADDRPLAGMPNAADVLSNLPFLVVGVLGMRFALGAVGGGSPAFAHRAEAVPWVVFFAAVALTAFGSAWYHSRPSDASLLWDRLPLALVFTSLLGVVIAERVGPRAGLLALPVLLAFGEFSVLYWYSAGDLRYYVAVQACAIVVVPMIVALLPGSHTRGGDWYLAVGVYALSKLAELGDGAIYSVGHLVSGHTLKHLLAAAGALVLLRMLRARHMVDAVT